MKKAQIFFLTLCSFIVFFSLYINRDFIVDAKSGINNDLSTKDSSLPNMRNRKLWLNKFDYNRWYAKEEASYNEYKKQEAQKSADLIAEQDAKRRMHDDKDKAEENKDVKKEEKKRDLDGTDSKKDENKGRRRKMTKRKKTKRRRRMRRRRRAQKRKKRRTRGILTVLVEKMVALKSMMMRTILMTVAEDWATWTHFTRNGQTQKTQELNIQKISI